MHFSAKLALRAGVLSVAAASAIVLPAGAAFAGSPSLSAAPNTGLKNGDTVTISGSNFATTSAWVAVQCSSLAPGGAGCSQTPGASGTTDGSGNIADTPFTVHTGSVGNGTCKPGSTCYIVATTDPGNPNDVAAAGFTTIKFLALPSLTVKPSKGIHDGQKVKVSGKNFPANKPLAIVVCASKTDKTKCDQTDGSLLTHSTNGSGSFSNVKVSVFTKGTQSGTCKPGGKCYVAATTDITGQGADPYQTAETRIHVVASVFKTKTTAAAHGTKVAGKVKAGKKGVKGLKVVLDMKHGKHWKKVAGSKTKKGGKFHFTGLSTGKYEVKTPKQHKGGKTYGASHSKKVHVKAGGSGGVPGSPCVNCTVG